MRYRRRNALSILPCLEQGSEKKPFGLYLLKTFLKKNFGKVLVVKDKVLTFVSAFASSRKLSSLKDFR